MSDAPTTPPDADADAVERLLDELARGLEPALEAGELADGGREYLELVGLIGAAVEPSEPPPAVKARLMAGVGAAARAQRAAAVVAPPAAGAPSSSVPSSIGPSSIGPSSVGLRRWALPLAASLAVALAGVSGFQATQLAGQRATIERLSERLEQVEARTASVDSLRVRLAEMRDRMALITGRGVEICALKPMSVEASLADSRGVLYVAPDHQHWYLTVEGLEPCSQGRSYQLWFVPEGGEPVSAGTFDVGAGVRVELSSDSMPRATRAVTITLEPAGGSARPTGPAVLHGDEVMAVL